jgi:DNA-directed RNA polymerase specialized sigma24 family protein
VRRRLTRDELAGEISPGAIDAASVVDEVAGHALAHPGTRPAHHGFRVWFCRLALWDLRRRYRILREAQRDSVSLDGTKWDAADEEAVHGIETEQPVKMISDQLEPPQLAGKPVMADQYGLSPEEELEHKDFIEYLQRISAGWPKVERDVFELHFLEGFGAEEVAVIENLTPEATAGTIGVVQQRIRQLMKAAVGFSAEQSRVAAAG